MDERMKWLIYKGETVGTATYEQGKFIYKPSKPCLDGRDPLWFWLRRKLSELGWSYQHETGGRLTLFPAGNEGTLSDVESCIAWTYHKALGKLYGQTVSSFIRN